MTGKNISPSRMYIRRIAIKGFRSYKEYTIIEPLNDHLNIFVGQNGSGKSTIIAAIIYALVPTIDLDGHESNTINLEYKSNENIIFENGQIPDHIEIVISLHNKDNNIENELNIRRIIGSGISHIYYINSKKMALDNVKKLLKQHNLNLKLGISAIKQGNIINFASITSYERFQYLLKIDQFIDIIINYKKYLKEMSGIEKKRQGIEEVMKEIDEKLKKLSKDQKIQDEMNKVSLQIKALQRHVLQNEINITQQKLSSVNNNLRLKRQELENYVDDTINTQEAEIYKKYTHEELLVSGTDIELIESEILEKEKHRQNLLDLLNSNEIVIKLQSPNELLNLSKDIQKKKEDLKLLERDKSQLLEQHKEISLQLLNCREESSILIEKKHLLEDFDNYEEKQKNLDDKIKYHRQKIHDLEQVINILDIDEKKLNEYREINTINEENITQEITKLNDLLSKEETQLFSYKKDHKNIELQQKNLWKQESIIKQCLIKLEEEFYHLQAKLYSKIPNEISSGLTIMRKFITQFQIDGVYGPLYELMNIDPIYYRSVEAIAKNRLFYIVVRDENVAIRLIKLLEAENQGRLTFIPINSIKNINIIYPENEEIYVPMIKVIDYNDEFTSIIQSIFGNVLIVPSLHVDKPSNRSFRLVNLDGDILDSSGIITGGYIRQETSKYIYICSMKSLQIRIIDYNKKYDNIKQQLNELNTQYNNLRDKIHSKEQNIRELGEKLEEIRPKVLYDNETYTLEIEKIHERRKELHNEIEICKNSLNVLEKLEKNPKKILSNNRLNVSDEARLSYIYKRQDELEKEESMLLESIKFIDISISKLTHELQLYLLPKMQELEKEFEYENIIKNIKDFKNDLNDTEIELDKLYSKLKLVREKKNQNNDVNLKIQKQLDQRENFTNKIENNKKECEEVLIKEQHNHLLLSTNLDILERKLANLKLKDGRPIPPNILEDKYKNFSKNDLLHEIMSLHKIYKSLSEQINESLLNSYIQLSNQRREITAQLTKLDIEYDAILKLADENYLSSITELDNLKDSLFERFNEVFITFVPDGCLEINIVCSISSSTNESCWGTLLKTESDLINQQNNSSIQLIIKARFGNSTEFIPMKLLSGGQKSIIAISFIIAVQSLGSLSELVLFDEIDANMDKNYRKLLARLIYNLRRQIIVTTFHPELVYYSKQCYGIIYQNDVSCVKSLNQEETFSFLNYNPNTKILNIEEDK